MLLSNENIPRFYTAIAECMSCFLYCHLLPHNLSWGKRIVSSSLFFVIQSLLLIFTEGIYIYFWLPVMICAVVLMFLFMSSHAECSKKVIFYSVLKAFLIAEFIASFEWQISVYINSFVELNLITNYTFMFIIYLTILIFIYRLEMKHIKEGAVYDVTSKELISVSLIVLGTFTFSNLSYLAPNTPFSGYSTSEIFNIRTLIDLGGLAILFAYQYRIYELQMEKGLYAVEQAFKAQYNYYKNYSENLEMMNIKYHDIKHQIEGLKGENSAEKKEQWIRSIEEELEDFRPNYETGNYILDTILSSKLIKCKKLNIKFTCVVNGELLKFLHILDLCNIFGNALDNAIEGAALVDSTQNRMIHLKVFSKCGFVYISLENSAPHKITMKNGYPVTTKEDRKNHGFGVKSIMHTIKKYHGEILFSSEEDMFSAQMIFPIKIVETDL